MDYGETDVGRLDPDQDQWITGREQRSACSGPSPMDHWEQTDRQSKQAETGVGRWESKNDSAPPVSKDAADGGSILAVAFKDKHLGSSSISFVQN